MSDLVENARRQTIRSIKNELKKWRSELSEQTEEHVVLEHYFDLRSDIPFLAPIVKDEQHPMASGIESLLESFRNVLAYSYRLGGLNVSLVSYQRKLMSVVLEARQNFKESLSTL
ncbi:hypothetical protein [Marinomonas mediterranea]|uniref:hypothetical protein n=1 Tax=Marinomonas mediterranea TaxID=119864 RepID=UPI00234A54CF|nr:hypothetical protein [Marinomonas mediterranea]WCN08440.1 hypothetical protein GV055_05640 [Marinomonas mediterranea]